MEKNKLLTEITEEYSAKILSWAIKKTGNRLEGENLAQEVFLQIFDAVLKQGRIEKLEHFIWKVAHFVWCNYLRRQSKSNVEMLDEKISDGTDFTVDLAEYEARRNQLSRMGRKIADLSFIQREAMILHYLDGLLIAEVAKRLNTTESAITWHLFDARKRIKKEFDNMKNDKSYVYRPRRLSLGCSGMIPSEPDTKKVNENLIRQNLCLLCYREGKSLDELAELTGIPKPYLEYDLQWLVKQEFLSLKGKKYSTTFPIISRKHSQSRGALYSSTGKEMIDGIINYLWENEAKIRAIGFYGSDFPTEKLMWSIIMMFISYTSRNSQLLLELKKRDEREIRPDGGKYYIIANDCSEDQEIVQNGYISPKGWNGYYGICADICATNGLYDRYYWLGVYTFTKQEYHPEIINVNNKPTQALLHKLYCSILEPDFSLDQLDNLEKEKLAEAIQDGLMIKSNDVFRPNFVVMTPQQLLKLQDELFAPLLLSITPKMEELSETFKKMYRAEFPKDSHGYIDYHTYIDLWNFGIFTLMFAAEEGKICLPETPEEGVPLTLVVVR